MRHEYQTICFFFRFGNENYFFFLFLCEYNDFIFHLFFLFSLLEITERIKLRIRIGLHREDLKHKRFLSMAIRIYVPKSSFSLNVAWRWVSFASWMMKLLLTLPLVSIIFSSITSSHDLNQTMIDSFLTASERKKFKTNRKITKVLRAYCLTIWLWMWELKLLYGLIY